MTPVEIDALYAGLTPPVRSGGSVDVSLGSLKPALLSQGVGIHELGLDSLQAALVGQTRLLNLGSTAFHNADNQALWAWCGEVLVDGATTQPGGQRNLDREQLMLHAIHAFLARLPMDAKPTSRDSVVERRRLAYSHHAQALVGGSWLAGLHLSFPLLEAVCRWYLETLVGPDGTILAPFVVPKLSGGSTAYGAPKGKKKISNLGDLLWKVDEHAGAGPFQANLRLMASIYRPGSTYHDGYAELFATRNRALHGNASIARVGGTVLNMALLIALEAIRGDFQAYRDTALRCVEFYGRRGAERPNWTFYPPGDLDGTVHWKT